MDYSKIFNEASQKGIYIAVTSDLLSLTLLTPPGELGADVVVGSSQRFGVPLGYGGPHAAFFATKEEFKRQIPGRIIGVSVDSKGRRALRMAFQTREQHIKREKATSNICTAQVLLAVMAGFYAVYHGPEGLKNIASRIHLLTVQLEMELNKLGLTNENEYYFDTLKIKIESDDHFNNIRSEALANNINFRYIDDKFIGISLGERETVESIKEIVRVFSNALNKSIPEFETEISNKSKLPPELIRTTSYLTHPVFHKYRSETEIMRYMKRLENKDLSLTTSMIPLGSCTMKLNAATEMEGITWPEFSDMHPFVPVEQAEGYAQIFSELEGQLQEITGFSGVSLQPNSGAQGEYTGLLVINAYQKDVGEGHRNIVLIPSSAHGTNPASAVMAANKVVIVKCDSGRKYRYGRFKK